MITESINFTEPKIVTADDLKHRSYVSFYFNGRPIRLYHGKSIGKNINPNRARSLVERKELLLKLHFEIKKALQGNSYPVDERITQDEVKVLYQSKQKQTLIQALFEAIKTKLRSGLSRTYKRDLKAVYRELRSFLNASELDGLISELKAVRIDQFLAQFGSSGTYYMNKRRTLGVLYNAACKYSEVQLTTIKETERRKSKAKLHVAYEKEQLKPIFDYLKNNYPKLYLCCLLTYGSWLRPHEEIRLLTVGPVQAIGNSIFFGDKYSLGKFAKDVAFDAVSGAIVGGTLAFLKGKNIWTGADVANGRTPFSFNKTGLGPNGTIKTEPVQLDQYGENPKVSYDEGYLRGKLDAHSFANDRFDHIGVPQEKFINNSLDLLSRNQRLLREGGNQWTGLINSQPVTFRINVIDGVVKGFNAFPGTGQNRVLGTLFNYGNLKW